MAIRICHSTREVRESGHRRVGQMDRGKMRMRNALLMLLFFSGPVVAEWVEVSTNNGITTYGNLIVQRNGPLVKMWRLIDFPSAQTLESGQQYFSTKSLSEYNCAEDSVRLIQVAAYSDRKGLGTLIHSENYDPTKWSPIAPRSINEALWKIACGRTHQH